MELLSMAEVLAHLLKAHTPLDEGSLVQSGSGRGEGPLGDRDSGCRGSGKGEGPRDLAHRGSGKEEEPRELACRGSGRGEGERDLVQRGSGRLEGHLMCQYHKVR